MRIAGTVMRALRRSDQCVPNGTEGDLARLRTGAPQPWTTRGLRERSRRCSSAGRRGCEIRPEARRPLDLGRGVRGLGGSAIMPATCGPDGCALVADDAPRRRLARCRRGRACRARRRVRPILLPGQPGLPAATAIASGIRAGLLTEWSFRVTIEMEHVDVARFASPEAEERRLRTVYGSKYGNQRFDVIVAALPEPFQFVLRARDDLWPGIPVVVCGVDERSVGDLKPPPGFAVLTIRYDMVGTVRAALALLPDTQHVALVGGASRPEQVYHDLVRQAVSAVSGLDVIDLTKLPIADVMARVSSLPEHTVIVQSSYQVDGAGRRFHGIDLVPHVSMLRTVPSSRRSVSRWAWSRGRVDPRVRGHRPRCRNGGVPIDTRRDAAPGAGAELREERAAVRRPAARALAPRRAATTGEQPGHLPPADALGRVRLVCRGRGRTHRGAGGAHRHAARSAPASPRGPGGAAAGRDGRAAPPESHCSSRPRRRHGPACLIDHARGDPAADGDPRQCAGGEAPARERRAETRGGAIVSRRHRQR